MVTHKKHKKHNKAQNKSKINFGQTNIKFIQSGGNWEYYVRKGIKEASHHYRTKNRLYYISFLAALKYLSAFKNKKQLNMLVKAIYNRLKEQLNIDLKRVSHEDFDMLQKRTRIIILKQDLSGKSGYVNLLENIRTGKLDNDLEWAYKKFGYATLDDTIADDIFRQSVGKKERIEFAKNLELKEVEKQQNEKNKAENIIKQKVLTELKDEYRNNIKSNVEKELKKKYKSKYKQKYNKKYKHTKHNSKHKSKHTKNKHKSKHTKNKHRSKHHHKHN